jgi:hypothetical protein
VTLARLEHDPTTECVVYRALYASKDFEAGTVWIRPRSSFEETICVQGVEMQRFVRTM